MECACLFRLHIQLVGRNRDFWNMDIDGYRVFWQCRQKASNKHSLENIVHYAILLPVHSLRKGLSSSASYESNHIYNKPIYSPYMIIRSNWDKALFSLKKIWTHMWWKMDNEPLIFVQCLQILGSNERLIQIWNNMTCQIINFNISPIINLTGCNGICILAFSFD